jgi:uncharacterized protein
MTSTALALRTPEDEPGMSSPGPSLDMAIAAACKRIAPLWPLKHFVAVNPFLGFTNQSFAETCATFDRVARTRMLMPRAFYAKALADGSIDDAALRAALVARPTDGMTVSSLKEAAVAPPRSDQKPPAVVATVAEVLDRCADGDRHVSLVAFMIDEISTFCAGYFDEGQANWPQPVRRLRPFAAWRALAALDRNPEVRGIASFRATIRQLPADPSGTIGAILTGLGIPERARRLSVPRPVRYWRLGRLCPLCRLECRAGRQDRRYHHRTSRDPSCLGLGPLQCPDRPAVSRRLEAGHG